MIITIIAFIVILSLLVLVHEFGHFIAAKKNGVDVEEFGFGFPPKIFGVKYKGTLYSLNWIPLGGFVKIKGVPGEEKNPELLKQKDSFAQKKFWQKLLILASGVLMNILLAAVLLSIGFMIGLPGDVEDNNIKSGAIVKDVHLQVIAVSEDSFAPDAGIEIGDTLVQIDGKNFSTPEQVQDYNRDKTGQVVQVILQRGDETLTKDVQVTYLTEENRGVLGLSLVKVGFISYPWYKAIWYGAITSIKLVWFVIVALVDLVRNLIVNAEVPSDVAGPVGIAAMTGQVTRLGFVYILQFVAVLSVNIALFNALPIPALDGGRLLFIIIEKIRRKANNEKIEGAAHRIGFILLLLLVLMVTFRDITRYSGTIIQFFKNILHI